MKGVQCMSTYRERFSAIHARRGYKVTEMGLITILEYEDYTAYWFFNPDGTVDESKDPYWTISRRK